MAKHSHTVRHSPTSPNPAKLLIEHCWVHESMTMYGCVREAAAGGLLYSVVDAGSMLQLCRLS
jgi:hypothetical protein